jgi:hypothetical protein
MLKRINPIIILIIILIFLFSCRTTDPALSHTLGKQKSKKVKTERIKSGNDKNCPGFKNCK